MKFRGFAGPVLAGVLLLSGAAVAQRSAPATAQRSPSATAQRSAPAMAQRSASATAQRSAASALSSIERGQWQLKGLDGERKLCLSKPDALLQLVHGSAACEHHVLEQTARSVTVQYVCRDHGQGRTILQIDNPKSLHISTQGVIDGSPFAEEYDGRLVGACPR